jgi:glutamine synthetase
MAFFAPNVNSYRRLVFGEVSPSNVHWGFDNRTCGLRVPLDTPENMRVESRFAGSDANPTWRWPRPWPAACSASASGWHRMRR